MNPATRGSDVNVVGGTLYRAPEPGAKSWKVAFDAGFIDPEGTADRAIEDRNGGIWQANQ